MSEYVQLFCKDHKQPFLPLLATSPEELLYPDYEQIDKEAGTMNSDALHRFHEEHKQCALTTRDK